MAVSVTDGVNGPGIHQGQADAGHLALLCLAKELKAHADGRGSVVEGDGSGDFCCALDFKGDVGNAVHGHGDFGEVIFPLVDGVLVALAVAGERDELRGVEPHDRIKIAFEGGEGKIAAGRDGFKAEAAIEIGKGGFGGREGVALVVLLAGFGRGGEGDGGKARRFAGVGAEHDAGDHALGGIGLLALKFVAAG